MSKATIRAYALHQQTTSTNTYSPEIVLVQELNRWHSGGRDFETNDGPLHAE